MLYVFAHNGAFDLPVIGAFSGLPALGWGLVKAVCDAPPIILKWRRETAGIQFIDTLNIWRMPLAKLATGYGMMKLPMPSVNASTEEWDRYGKNDTDIIRSAVIGWLAFIRKHDLGPFAATLASQAFKTYKYRFMQHPIFIDNNDNALAIARSSYVGGRTECFHIGELQGPLYYLDVNSMYPAVMRANDYPCKLRSVYTRPDNDEINKWREDFIMIGEVDIDTPCADYPVISDNKLMFPTGRYTTTLAHPELMRAFDRGHIAKWHSVVLYEKAPLFASFVDTLYGLRLQASTANNETEKFNIKIMMNSLYGKFGQRGRRFEEVGTTDPDAVWTHTEIDADTDTTIRYRAFGGLVQAWVEDAESSESFPAIAACVTSHARVLLLDAMELCGNENRFYTDTDSLIVNAEGMRRMASVLHNSDLGKWKLAKTITSMTIHGPKDYVLDGERTIKGIRSTAVRIAHNTYEQDKFVGFRGLLQSGQLKAPVVHRATKKLARVYTKGTVLPSGRVRPLRMAASKRGAAVKGRRATRKR